jgi:hypothetical protein
MLGIGGARQHRLDIRDQFRVGAQVHRRELAVEAEVAACRRVADQHRTVELGRQDDRRQDGRNDCPPPSCWPGATVSRLVLQLVEL